MYKLNYPWLIIGDTHPVECCLCQSRYFAKEVNRFTINDKIFKIRKCTKDDLFFLSPQPGLKYAQSLYNHPSYYQGVDDMYGLLINDRKSSRIAKIRIKEIKKYAPHAKSILEIGCGHSHVLEIAGQVGFTKTDGLELSKEAIKICQKKGLNVSLINIKELYQQKFLKGPYDVVAMYSLLEHLENPLVFLKKIKYLLKRKGILIVRVPDTDSKIGPTMSFVDHLWHFTRTSLLKTLELAGFKVIDIFASGVFKGLTHGGEMKNMTVVAILA